MTIKSDLSPQCGLRSSLQNFILILIMQRQLLAKTAGRAQKSKSLQPIIGNSSYVVNNSFHCAMQPKRTSFDVKLFLQLHRKLIRKAIIEKTFEESLYQFSNQEDHSRRGFKGNLISEHRLQNSISHRQRRMRTEGSSKLQAAPYLNSSTHSTLSHAEQARKTNGVMSSHTKPNMMYNLSLYRKNYKRKDLKNDKACMKVMQNFSKTSEQFTRQSNSRRAKKLITIS